MKRRPRLDDGSFGELESIGSLLTAEEQLAALQALNRNLMLTVTDMYEENLEIRELNRNVMLVVTDLYEAMYPEEGEI